MRKPLVLYLLFLSTILVLFSSAYAFSVELLFFYEKGCPECAKVNDLLQKRIKPNYPVAIKAYEIHEPGNAALLMNLARAYEAKDIIKKGTPAVFIGENAFQGSSRAIQRKIEEAVRASLRAEIPSPMSRLQEENHKGDFKKKITLPAVISAAAVDSINPCACAVLVLLLGTMLLVSKRKRISVLGAGFAFTLACFISYFLMGLGLFSAVQVVGIQHYIYIAVTILAVLMGLLNLRESLKHVDKFTMEVPQSWQPKLKRLTSNIVSVPGAFFVGLLISLFLLPCTSGPYVVIIGMLGDTVTRVQALWLLFLYNTIFILPFVIITLGVGFGLTTTARVETWRQENLPKFHLITGLFMIALGLTMFVLLLIGTI